MKFSFELHSLLVGIIHDVSVFLQLIYLDLILTKFLSANFFNFLDLILELIHNLIAVFLVDLLELRDFILQRNRSLQLLIVFLFQTTFHISFINLLLCKSIMQFSDRVLPKDRKVR